MNQKNLSDATMLFEIIGKYVPENPNEEMLDYINEIFENIKKDNNYDSYFEAILLMTGKSFGALGQMNPVDVLELFITSLMDWHIVELVAFFRNVGYSNDRPA